MRQQVVLPTGGIQYGPASQCQAFFQGEDLHPSKGSIYIYMYGISMHILWDAISQLCAAEVEANAAVGCLIYILYIKGLKSPTRQTITLQTRHKSEKRGKDDTHEVRRGFTFLFDFPKNASWDIQTHRCTKVIKHCACAVKSTSLGR